MRKILTAILGLILLPTIGCSQKINKIEIDFDKNLALPQMDSLMNLDPLVGFLISMPDSTEWDRYVSPLKINFWRTNVWDFNILTPLLKKYPNIHIQLVLGDKFPRGSYAKSDEIPFSGYSQWLQEVNKLLSTIPVEYYSRISIDIYNEPNASRKWPNSYQNFYRFFCETVSYINSTYPDLKIAGPSIEGEESYHFIEEILGYMMKWKALNDDIPLRLDQLTIHALGQSPRKCIQDIPKYLHLIDSAGYKESLGIKDLVYNEYCNRNQTDNFADAVRMLESFEKNGIRYASRACWGTCTNGSLDNLLIYDDGNIKPNQNWYGYKYYSMLIGKRFESVAPEGISVIAGGTRDHKLGIISSFLDSPSILDLRIAGLQDYFVYEILDSGISKIHETGNVRIAPKGVVLLSEIELD